MSHAVVGMVEALRAEGRFGLLFANGGFATHNHSIVLGRDPIPGAVHPSGFDFQDEADRMRGAVPVTVEDYEGPARIETYTVLYERNGTPKHGVIVARTPNGDRTLAMISGNDRSAIAFLTDGIAEPVGSAGEIRIDADGWQVWQPVEGVA
jgi:acetyl-CoA C-acetyltransferase